jgi:hypothetical protein
MSNFTGTFTDGGTYTGTTITEMQTAINSKYDGNANPFVLGSIDDSASVSTNAQLATAFPSALLGSVVFNVAKTHVYILVATGIWVYAAVTACA